jgi:hypothetical protein
MDQTPEADTEETEDDEEYCSDEEYEAGAVRFRQEQNKQGLWIFKKEVLHLLSEEGLRDVIAIAQDELERLQEEKEEDG